MLCVHAFLTCYLQYRCTKSHVTKKYIFLVSLIVAALICNASSVASLADSQIRFAFVMKCGN